MWNKCGTRRALSASCDNQAPLSLTHGGKGGFAKSGEAILHNDVWWMQMPSGEWAYWDATAMGWVTYASYDRIGGRVTRVLNLRVDAKGQTFLLSVIAGLLAVVLITPFLPWVGAAYSSALGPETFRGFQTPSGLLAHLGGVLLLLTGAIHLSQTGTSRSFGVAGLLGVLLALGGAGWATFFARSTYQNSVFQRLSTARELSSPGAPPVRQDDLEIAGALPEPAAIICLVASACLLILFRVYRRDQTVFFPETSLRRLDLVLASLSMTMFVVGALVPWRTVVGLTVVGHIGIPLPSVLEGATFPTVRLLLVAGVTAVLVSLVLGHSRVRTRIRVLFLIGAALLAATFIADIRVDHESRHALGWEWNSLAALPYDELSEGLGDRSVPREVREMISRGPIEAGPMLVKGGALLFLVNALLLWPRRRDG